MKVDIDTLSPVQRKIRVELPANAVNKEFSRVYEGLSQRAKIKGFRPGKAPRSVLERLYGDQVKGQVLSQLVEHSLGEVFRERGLPVVSRPEVEANDLEEGRAFTFSAVVEVKPEIEVKNYLGLEVEKVKLSVEEAQLEFALRRLQDSHAHLEPVEDRDVVERGDLVVLDFVGSIDGKPFPGGKAENYHLEVGGENALPQFEEAIVGLKKNGEHTISVAYPEDHFNRELAGKMVVFSVTVREIKKKILPTLDDEFAKDHGECASLDELRQKVRTRLESELREIQTKDLKEQLLSRFIEAHPFEVPSAMLDHQIRYLMERHQARLATQGSAPSGERPSMEQMRKDLEPHALRQVQATLLIEKIAALEKIHVSDEEIHGRVEEVARSAGERGMALREFYRRGDAREDLRSQMVFERTVDFLLQRAKVKEVEPPVDAQEKKS
ncbi:MAG: trigger factor [Candidatus Binatia bacterium]